MKLPKRIARELQLTRLLTHLDSAIARRVASLNKDATRSQRHER